jgi:DNA repair exonuclease SbcCD ATPase subunit
MSKTMKKEEMVKNSNQPQQKEKNIEFLMNEMNTFEIIDSDVENIFNSNYLKECLERLEGDEYHIERSIRTIKDRISDIEHISQIEEEIKNNLSEIDDLYRFIDKVCDNDEDKEEPLSKIEELLEQNEELNDEITGFYENLNKN